MDSKITNVTSADVSTYTDITGLARLKQAARAKTPEALEAVAKQFESLFLEMMLKSMRDASLGDGIFDSESSDFYQGMFDKQVSLDLSRGKGLGIADMLMRQLAPSATPSPEPSPPEEGERELTGSATVSFSTPSAQPSPPAKGERELAASASAPASSWRPDSPFEFVRDVLPYARKAASLLKVNPLALVAQAAVETGWGKHLASAASGASSFNLFGIKATGDWNGPKVAARTLEVEEGMPVAKQTAFRRYGSIAESFEDYVKLIKSNPHYQEVLARGADAHAFADAMGRSGYATDPDYASKIKGILSGDSLRGALETLKASLSGPIF